MTLRGNIDLADRRCIEGWAQWPERPTEPVALVITINGVEIGQFAADRFRADLLQASIGNGMHAFRFQYASPLSLDEAHVLSITDEAGDALPGSPVTLAVSKPLQGHLDLVDRYRVHGWAYNPDTPDVPVKLVIRAAGKNVGHLLANRFRDDLKQAKIGAGRHAFAFDFEAPLSPIERHTIEIYREDDRTHVAGSPATLPPEESFGPEARNAIDAVLVSCGSDADVEEKIMFLSERLCSLAQQKADVDGKRQLRDRNRRLLERWSRRELEEFPAGTADVKRALVVDNWIPPPDQDAGSVAIVSHMRSLQRLGYEVTLAPAQLFTKSNLDGGALDGVSIARPPVYQSIEELLLRQRNEFDLIYLHRIDNASKFLQIARENNPKAKVIFGVADLHLVRIARQAEVEDRPELRSYGEH